MGTKSEDILLDCAKDMTQAMKEVTRAVDTQNIQWPQFIDTLNSQFVLHNNKTEELGRYVQQVTEETMKFRTDIWSKMWSLFEKIIMIFAVMAGGSIVAKLVLGV